MSQPGNADMEATFALKKVLRKQVASRLKQLSQQDLQRQSQAVRDLIVEKGYLDKARGVCCYLSMDSGELSTRGIVSEILRRDIPLFVPIIPPPAPKPTPTPSSSTTQPKPKYTPPPPENDMRMVRLYSQEDFDACPLDKWGIPDAGRERRDGKEEGLGRREDAEDEGSPLLDVILVPGVAFDSANRRLGHGKGYYDRYIQRYREAAKAKGEKPPTLVALALDEQMQEEAIPCTGNDVVMDVVIHPSMKA